MKLAIIAANGRLGQLLVVEALAAGHSVRAGLRGTSRLQPHDKLTVIACDATNPAELRRLIQGCDAVLSAIGHVKGSPADLQTRATAAVIQVMNELGMRRFVDITGSGVRFPGDRISLADRFLNWSIALIDQPRITDGRQHQRLLQASGLADSLDWTTIRVLKLQNIRPRPHVLSLSGPAQTIVSRTDAAREMLHAASDARFILQAPIISKR